MQTRTNELDGILTSQASHRNGTIHQSGMSPFASDKSRVGGHAAQVILRDIGTGIRVKSRIKSGHKYIAQNHNETLHQFPTKGETPQVVLRDTQTGIRVKTRIKAGFKYIFQNHNETFMRVEVAGFTHDQRHSQE